MGDYYRRERHDGDDRRYSRDHESHHRPLDYHSERAREDRHPPPRQRSRERYQDRDREDYAYRRDRDRDRETRHRDPRSEDRDRNYGSPPVSPPSADHDNIDHPPRGPRSDRGKQQQYQYAEDSFDAGKPNAQVIFRGLDKQVTETDVYIQFHALRTITNIRSCNNSFTFNKTLPLKV